MKKLKKMYRGMEVWMYGNIFVRHCEKMRSIFVAIQRRCCFQSSNHLIVQSSAVRGFTLVELVITIALIVILSTISVPIYKDYIWKTKIAEGYTLLAKIRDAEFAYYNEYGNFLKERDSSGGSASWTCNEEVLGIDARANKYFTKFSVGYISAYTGTNCINGFLAILEVPAYLRVDGKNWFVYHYHKTRGARMELTNDIYAYI